MTTFLNRDIEVREISAEDTFKLRQQVLRPGKPIEQCFFDGDHAEDTLHLGIFVQQTLSGVASFMKNSNPLFSPPTQFQLRGMAILQDKAKQGLGSKLLLHGESEILKRFEAPVIWFNARTHAVGFYKKFGYQTISEEFDIPNVCKHIVMFKAF